MGEGRRSGVVIAAVIGLIAAAALAGTFRPQLAQAWGSVSGSTQAQEEEVRLAVERYAQTLDMASGESEKVKARLNDGIVTERYWSSEEGRAISDDADDSDSLFLVTNCWLAGWNPEQCCSDGRASGVAEIGQDWRVYDLGQDPEDSSTPLLEGTRKAKIGLIEQDGRWKVDRVEEIKDGDE